MIILKKNIQEKRLGEDEEITPEEMNFISTFSRLAEMIDETPSKKTSSVLPQVRPKCSKHRAKRTRAHTVS